MRADSSKARSSVLVAVSLAFALLAAIPTASAEDNGPGAPARETVTYTRGEPWRGDPAVTESVAEIMSREPAPTPASVTESAPRRVLVTKRGSSQPGAAVTGVRTPEPALPQSVGTSFLGIKLSDSMFIPPDSMGDVGPTQVLVGANGRIRVFDKSGVLGGLNATMDNFFASVVGPMTDTSDPHIRYDRLSGRWFVSIITLDTPVNEILIAVSSGPTITSAASFSFFKFQHDLVGDTPNVDTGLFADYDTLGVDRFALYIGVNVFDLAAQTFSNTTGFVVDKADLLAATLTVTAFRGLIDFGAGEGIVTPQGVDNDDPGATAGFFVGVDLQFDELALRRVIDPGGTPAISSHITLPVLTTTSPIDQVQPSPGPTLDAIDHRLFAAQLHTNKITGTTTLWTAHNIEVNSSGVGTPGGGRNGSRWYEIGVNYGSDTVSLVQSGTLFDPAGVNPFGYWIPSVAMSGQGHMAIGASRASASAPSGYPSIAVAGRLRTDALGATRAPTLAQASTFNYDQFGTSPERWGDYSQTVVDPTDDQTMWTFQEYADATNSWAVRAIQLRAPLPATPSSASPPSVAVGEPSVAVTVGGTSTAGSEFFDPGPDTGGPGFANHVSASIPGGVTVNSVQFASPTQVQLNVSTVGATPGTYDVTVTNPDGQNTTGSNLLTVTPSAALSISDTAVTEGDAGTKEAQLTVTLSPVSTDPVSVSYASSDGTASSSNDYAPASGTLEFSPGTGQRVLTVTVNGDTLSEDDETFSVNLSSPVNATIADGLGVATILDDDPLPSISISDTAVTEGDSGTRLAELTVSLSAVSGRAVSVGYSVVDGVGASSPADYVASSGSVVFAAGTAQQILTVTVNGDTLYEGGETFVVSLSSPVNATIADAQATGLILDDDPTPSLSIADASIVEGDSGTRSAVVTVTLSPASGQPASVDYSAADGNATSPADYALSSGTLMFAPGETQKTVTATVKGDTLVEGDETFSVTLDAPIVNASVADGVGQVTIVDDDVPSLSVGDTSVSEGDGIAVLTVTLAPAATETVSVAYATDDGTALATGDYEAGSSVLSFSPGQSSRVVTVTVVPDALDEDDETFVVNLSSPVSAVLADAQGAVTILDDDPLPSITVADASVAEGDAGTRSANVVVSLSALSGRQVTVNYLTGDGSATSPTDYATSAGTLTFAPDQSAQPIQVTVNSDTTDEPDETFTVNLSSPVNATIADAQAIVSIADDDLPPAEPATLTFFFAEGYLRDDPGNLFVEILNLANFSALAGTAEVVYSFGDAPPVTRTYAVAAGETLCIVLSGITPQSCDKAGFLPTKEVSMKVTTPANWLADRQVYFSSQGWTGGHEQVGVASPATTWYFAEGTTLAPFSEFITIQNANAAAPASLQVEYLTDCGRNQVQTKFVPPLTRSTINVKDVIGEGCTGVSAVVRSDVPIVAERPLYFVTDFGGALSPAASDGHDVFGVGASAARWLFAEGTTLGGFREFLALGNPSDLRADVVLHYVFTGGRPPEERRVVVEPRSRTTVQVYNAADPGGVGEGIEGVSVEVESSVPILAERPMYMSRLFPNGIGGVDFLVTGGHDAVGSRAPGTVFTFVGASSQQNRAAYLTVQNALPQNANLTITYIGLRGALGTATKVVPAQSRANVVIFDPSTGGVPTPEPAPIGIRVVSDSPVLVEQPSYFNFASFDGATNVVGFG